MFTTIKGISDTTEREYYVLVRDCRGDSTVKSDIIDSCEKLSESKYEKIIGLRDVYPLTDIEKLQKGLRLGIPTKYMPIHILLAVMEIEAWFLAETEHFRKIHDSITLEMINQEINLDILNIDIEKINHPAEDLDNIYKLAGLRYGKKKSIVERTVFALDYSQLYINVSARLKYFGEFIQQIDTYLN